MNECKDKIRKLLYIKRSISKCLRENQEELDHIRNVRIVQACDIIELADYISRTIKAPPLWKPGNPVVGGHPPAPQPEQMRLGKLGEHHLQLESLNPHDSKEITSIQTEQIDKEANYDETLDDLGVKKEISSANSTESRSSKVLLPSDKDEQHPAKKARIISVNFDEMSSDSD